jgi:hypothetical protein
VPPRRRVTRAALPPPPPPPDTVPACKLSPASPPPVPQPPLNDVGRRGSARALRDCRKIVARLSDPRWLLLLDRAGALDKLRRFYISDVDRPARRRDSIGCDRKLASRVCVGLRRIGYQKCINSLDTIVQQGYRVISVLRGRPYRAPSDLSSGRATRWSRVIVGFSRCRVTVSVSGRSAANSPAITEFYYLEFRAAGGRGDGGRNERDCMIHRRSFSSLPGSRLVTRQTNHLLDR